MESDKFCLKWNDFASNISSALGNLRNDTDCDLFDVTLACEDQTIRAHKLILSACSPFFKNIFKSNHHSHPLLYLHGIKNSEISAILNFIYYGEVNVAQEDLKSFLAVAEDLKIKGLTDQNESKSIDSSGTNSNESINNSINKVKSSNSKSNRPGQSFQTKKTLNNPFSGFNSHNLMKFEDDADIEEVQVPQLKVKSSLDLLQNSCDDMMADSQIPIEPKFDIEEDLAIASANQGNKDEIIDAMIESILVRRSHPLEGTMYECSVCQKQAKKKDKMQAHAEIHLKGFSHKCHFCGKNYKTRPSLKVHISTTHKSKEVNINNTITPKIIGIESILG